LGSRLASLANAVVLVAMVSACAPPGDGPADVMVEQAARSRPIVGTPHTVTFDKYSLLVDGQRLYLWSGEFHYWRLPSPDLWRDVLEKMKAAGYNAANIYF